MYLCKLRTPGNSVCCFWFFGEVEKECLQFSAGLGRNVRLLVIFLEKNPKGGVTRESKLLRVLSRASSDDV